MFWIRAYIENWFANSYQGITDSTDSFQRSVIKTNKAMIVFYLAYQIICICNLPKRDNISLDLVER